MDNPPNRPTAHEGGVDEMDTPDQHPPADDTPDQHPPADQGGVDEIDTPRQQHPGGSARSEDTSISGGSAPAWGVVAPLAVGHGQSSSAPWTSTGGGAAGAAQTVSSTIIPGEPRTAASIDVLPAVERSPADTLDRGFRPSAPPEVSRTIEAPLARTGTQFSDTRATPTALEESTLRLASGLEFMNLTGGGEPPAVERPSTSTTMARKRTPGRWRRIPRWWTPPDDPPEVKEQMAKADLVTLKNIEFIRNMKEKDCDLETEEDVREFHAFKEKMIRSLTLLVNSKPEDIKVAYKRFSDTREEHLTAEGMEAYILPQFPESKRCQQAKHFAELALNHYNKKRTESRKFKLATTLLSNCFSERSGTTYGHVNFTAILEEKTATQPTSKTKRLFFAELMLIPKLQADPKAEPMRVVHVYVIDDDYCYGGCKKIFRKIDHKMRREMDYERCHACSDLIKHPKGQFFDGGHNSSRMPYFSAE